jgi:hypothetical protein
MRRRRNGLVSMACRCSDGRYAILVAQVLPVFKEQDYVESSTGLSDSGVP